MPSQHPKKSVGCHECGADAPDTWQQKRRLPQIGQTYVCGNCGQEVYSYDAGDPGEAIMQWRPVTAGMATNLQFLDIVGRYPDDAVEELIKQGLERIEAIDYHIVESEGLTQSEWGSRRGVAQPTVAENIQKAKEKLGAKQ